MKINKQFAPITVTIEYQEELEFLLTALQDAQRYYMSNGFPICSPRRITDPYMQKADYLLKQLK